MTPHTGMQREVIPTCDMWRLAARQGGQAGLCGLYSRGADKHMIYWMDSGGWGVGGGGGVGEGVHRNGVKRGRSVGV